MNGWISKKDVWGSQGLKAASSGGLNERYACDGDGGEGGGWMEAGCRSGGGEVLVGTRRV